MDSPSYGLTRELPDSGFEQAIEHVTEALKTEGFGILTRIDVHQTLKARIGAQIPEYAILGACNPGLALGAIQAEPWVGLLLPCNVVVRALDGGGVGVSIAHPAAMFQVIDNPAMGPLVQDVEARLRRVLDRVGVPDLA